MKKVLLSAALLLSSVAMFAQHEVGTLTIQPKAGLNIANVTKVDGKARVDFVGGAELEYQVDDIISLSGGVLYSRQGSKAKKGDGKWAPSYLNVPILANVYPVEGLAVKLGVQPGFMIDKDKADEAKKFDLSIPVGLSYEYSNFVIDGRYNFGVTKLFKDGNSKNSVFQITVGYKFEL